jgi:exopolyphosphatase/guanosine-5'-triphosphate,3'-diphosphate pyrophosphatase
MGVEAGAKAAIDLGTNTVLMVIGRKRADGSVEVLDDVHAIARLGQGVDANRRILPEAQERVCRVLSSYRELGVSCGADEIRAFGTSALRDAANKEDFVQRVRSDAGIDLVEVSGADEARHTFRGAAFGMDLPERYAVVDLGGGSTELALGSEAGLERAASADVGAVRVTERCFPQLPPTDQQQQHGVEMARVLFEELFPLPDVALVGVAGTVTTLGALDMRIDRFDAEDLNGHFLKRERVEELAGHLLSLRYEEIRAMPQVSDQRADIISAGALILRTFLHVFAQPGLTVSTRGIRYGLLLDMLGA